MVPASRVIDIPGRPRQNTPGLVPGVFFCLSETPQPSIPLSPSLLSLILPLRTLLLVTLPLLTLSAGAVAADAGNCPRARYPAGSEAIVAVRKVQDGDSFTTSDGRKIRLIGVNAPELGGSGGAAQPVARTARRFVEDFVRANPKVMLVPGSERHDKYGRQLAHVYSLSGQSLEAALVARGLGWHVAIPPNLALADCLSALEREARRRRAGLWAGELAVAAQQLDQGGFQRVVGRVDKIVFAKAWWINLDGKLAGVIYPEHQRNFSRSQLRALEGRDIVLRGWVYASTAERGKPWRVKVETPYGIEK